MQEHGEDKNAKGMQRDIQNTEKLVEIESGKNPMGRIFFISPCNEFIRMMRKFPWLELEEILEKKGLEFYLEQ